MKSQQIVFYEGETANGGLASKLAVRPLNASTKGGFVIPQTKMAPRRSVADVYGYVLAAGIHHAPSIKVVQSAKVIENPADAIVVAVRHAQFVKGAGRSCCNCSAMAMALQDEARSQREARRCRTVATIEPETQQQVVLPILAQASDAGERDSVDRSTPRPVTSIRIVQQGSADSILGEEPVEIGDRPGQAFGKANPWLP